jgi:hypothetical protein
MDLRQFEGLAKSFEDGVWIDIVYPENHPLAGENTGLRVNVAAYASERVKRVERRLLNIAIEKNKRNPKLSFTVEDNEQRAKATNAAAFISWSGFELDGVALECTPENVMNVLNNTDLWFVGKQVDNVASDLASFKKA